MFRSKRLLYKKLLDWGIVGSGGNSIQEDRFEIGVTTIGDQRLDLLTVFGDNTGEGDRSG